MAKWQTQPRSHPLRRTAKKNSRSSMRRLRPADRLLSPHRILLSHPKQQRPLHRRHRRRCRIFPLPIRFPCRMMKQLYRHPLHPVKTAHCYKIRRLRHRLSCSPIPIGHPFSPCRPSGGRLPLCICRPPFIPAFPAGPFQPPASAASKCRPRILPSPTGSLATRQRTAGSVPCSMQCQAIPCCRPEALKECPAGKAISSGFSNCRHGKQQKKKLCFHSFFYFLIDYTAP